MLWREAWFKVAVYLLSGVGHLLAWELIVHGKNLSYQPHPHCGRGCRYS